MNNEGNSKCITSPSTLRLDLKYLRAYFALIPSGIARVLFGARVLIVARYSWAI